MSKTNLFRLPRNKTTAPKTTIRPATSPYVTPTHLYHPRHGASTLTTSGRHHYSPIFFFCRTQKQFAVCPGWTKANSNCLTYTFEKGGGPERISCDQGRTFRTANYFCCASLLVPPPPPAVSSLPGVSTSKNECQCPCRCTGSLL